MPSDTSKKTSKRTRARKPTPSDITGDIQTKLSGVSAFGVGATTAGEDGRQPLQLAIAYSLSSSPTPGLRSLAGCALPYLSADYASNSILVDLRTVWMAVLRYGERIDVDESSPTGLVEWLIDNDRYQPGRLPSGRQDEIESLFDKGFNIAATAEVHGVMEKAGSIAQETTGRDQVRLRNVVAALILDPPTGVRILRTLEIQISEDEFDDIRAALFRYMSKKARSPDEIEGWRKVLRISDARPKETPEETPKTERQAPQDEPPSGATVSPDFASDRPNLDSKDDSLGVQADIDAFAKLICLKRAEPPLSIGLFGGWGTGKSTFMERLEKAIDERTGEERDRRFRSHGQGEPDPEKIYFVADVMHIRFNAWHFADANLWASLTAEFFDQFRAGGHARAGQEVYAQLVEKVNAHVNKLSGDATQTNAALAKGEQDLRAAQKDRDTKVASAQMGDTKAVAQVLVDGMIAQFDAHKDALVRLGFVNASADPSAAITRFAALAGEASTTWGQLQMLWRWLRRSQWRYLLPVAAIGLAAAVVTFFAALHETALIAGVFTLVATTPVVGKLIAIGAQLRGLLTGAAGLAARVDKSEQARLADALASEARLRELSAEVEARHAAADRAAKALSRYVGPEGAPNPPRLLRYMLEDDPDTRAMEKEIGLIGRARRLFQAVDLILADGKRCPGEPERIVLYIDDLDRCSHDQVYAVLQAIHLLLAFKLFVVVVGVDVNWVQEAILRQLDKDQVKKASTDAEMEEARRRALAISYLQKIFQIPFWLRPLSAGNGGSYEGYVRSVLRSYKPKPKPDAADTAQTPPTVSIVTQESQIASFDDLAREVSASSPDRIEGLSRLPTQILRPAILLDDQPAKEPPRDETIATVTLTTAEEDFLAGQALGALAAADARGVKRMLNVYRLIRARLTAVETRAVTGDAATPPLFPVLAVCVGVETGQLPEAADHFYFGLLELAGEQLTIDELAKPNSPRWPGSAEIPLRQHRLEKVFRSCPALRQSVEAVFEARGKRATPVADFIAMAVLARRYSFNRLR